MQQRGQDSGGEDAGRPEPGPGLGHGLRSNLEYGWPASYTVIARSRHATRFAEESCRNCNNCAAAEAAANTSVASDTRGCGMHISDISSLGLLCSPGWTKNAIDKVNGDENISPAFSYTPLFVKK